MAQAVETQFDTAAVAAFEAILAGAHEDYRLAKGSEFDVLSMGGGTFEPEVEPTYALSLNIS